MAKNKRVKRPQPSTIRTRRLYYRRKQELIDFLGGQCVYCGELRVPLLTFDHTDERNWEPNQVHGTKRLNLYLKDAEAGKLQLACKSCNSRKGDDTEEEIPF